MACRKVKDTIEIDGKRYSCRIYDNGGETSDRYTICLARQVDDRGKEYYPYIGCNSQPFYGIGYHGESQHKIDGAHLGRRIAIEDCPVEVQKFIRTELGRT